MTRACELAAMKMRSGAMALILLLAALTPATAQIPGMPKSSAPAAEAPADPMGRTTPRDALIGFSRAVDRGDFMAAARYLQLKGAQRQNAPTLAAQLKSVIDRELHEGLASISNTPSGSLDDGLGEDLEKIGPLDIEGEETYLTLVRVNDPEDGHIWLVSSETLRLVPALAQASGKTWIERVMPASLLAHSFLGLSFAHWLVLLTLLFASFALFWVLGLGLNFIIKAAIRDPLRRQGWHSWYHETRWPAITALTIILQFVVIPWLGFPIAFRVGYARVGVVAFVFVATWLLRRGLSLAFTHARAMVRGKDRASTQSLMLLAERMIQAVIVGVAIIMVLIVLGVESKTALAGLGIVGVALALGAQKTVENLLGGIFLLSDKALAVGDYCTISNQSGWIEDVTLRSVRMRTVNQSLLSLPAGSLAQTGVENFATRRKIPINTTLRLKYGTSAAQLKRILAEVGAFLEGHAKLERGESYFRLLNFGVEAIELELFAYVLTAHSAEFRAVREEVLLEIATRVEAAGSALAPMRFFQIQQGGDDEDARRQ
jgi:MscS family membrane protein